MFDVSALVCELFGACNAFEQQPRRIGPQCESEQHAHPGAAIESEEYRFGAAPDAGWDIRCRFAASGTRSERTASSRRQCRSTAGTDSAARLRSERHTKMERRNDGQMGGLSKA